MRIGSEAGGKYRFRIGAGVGCGHLFSRRRDGQRIDDLGFRFSYERSRIISESHLRQPPEGRRGGQNVA